MKKHTLLALALLFPLSSNADIHKCVSNGRTSYQDTPCDQGEVPLAGSGTLSTLPIQVPEAYPLSPGTSKAPSRSQRSSGINSYQSTTERRNAEVRARTRGIVIPGMSERQAISILGEPSSTSTSTRGGRVCRYLRWDGSRPFQEGYHRVTICNGEVSSYSAQHQ